VAIDILLAFLRPRYSLLYNAESDYGRGPWYWLMDLNFLLRCALSLALAGALAQSFPGRVRGGLGLLVTWVVCSGLLAFFADDPRGQPATASGRIRHALGGLYERIFLGLELLWIAVVAARIALGRPAPVTAPAPARRPRQPERR
jgi:Protein of unknown function (DUF998)